jgi:phosphopantetheinyl transferase
MSWGWLRRFATAFAWRVIDARPAPVRTEGQWFIESVHAPGEYPDAGGVDVWLCSVGCRDEILRANPDTLDGLEKARAAAFREERAGSVFLERRVMVRVVISRYLSVRSGDVVWETGPAGKPFLQTQAGRDDLEFSWSQAGAMVVIAVTRGIAVGVDACRESEGDDLDGLAEVFCSEAEVSALERMPRPERVRALVQCWTAKEACLKAAGTGLRCDPQRLRTWGDDEPLKTVEWDEGAEDAPRRHMAVVHRSVAGGIALAVAAPVPLCLTIHRLTWNGGDEHGQP